MVSLRRPDARRDRLHARGDVWVFCFARGHGRVEYLCRWQGVEVEVEAGQPQAWSAWSCAERRFTQGGHTPHESFGEALKLP